MKAFKCPCSMGVSASSLHRESTNSLISHFRNDTLPFSISMAVYIQDNLDSLFERNSFVNIFSYVEKLLSSQMGMTSVVCSLY